MKNTHKKRHTIYIKKKKKSLKYFLDSTKSLGNLLQRDTGGGGGGGGGKQGGKGEEGRGAERDTKPVEGEEGHFKNTTSASTRHKHEKQPASSGTRGNKRLYHRHEGLKRQQSTQIKGDSTPIFQHSLKPLWAPSLREVLSALLKQEAEGGDMPSQGGIEAYWRRWVGSEGSLGVGVRG